MQGKAELIFQQFYACLLYTSFYQGRSVSWEDLGGSSEKRMGSGRYLTFRYPCSVVTSQETYRILFYYTAYHEDEPGQDVYKRQV